MSGAVSISINRDYDNPWDLRPDMSGEAWSEPAVPALRIEIIEGVEPLDTQLGVFPKRTVPDALYDAMFGQPDPTAAEIEAAGGDAKAVSPLLTFAILDAAKLTNLPELLDRSDLDHRCLFKGAAYNELKNVAPWIVRLEEDNTFTRNLFTRSDAHWHLWGKEPGIYVRARGSLEAMWKHFRKFTRVQSPAGKWYYLRFWDKSVLNAARRGSHDAEFYQKLVNHMAIIWNSPQPDIPNRFLQLKCEVA